MSATQHPTRKISPNSEPRTQPVRFLVLHATAGSYESALGWLTNPASKVSAHYLVAKDGCVTQLVEENRVAWHAGVSAWAGVTNLNATSIGIELENRNDGADPYPESQIASTVRLSREIIARHMIARGNVVRHKDISPGRKTDPAGLHWSAFVARCYPSLDHCTDLPPRLPRYRARALAYVRALPTTGAERLKDLQRGDVVVVREIVTGQTVQHNTTISDQWAETPTGYVWLPQLEALP